MKIFLTILYICFTTLGIFLMKLGGDSLSLNFSGGVNLKVGFVTALGFFSYLCSFLLWQKLLTSFDLSYIVPLTTGISQIVILLIGMILFNESINLTGIIGVILTVIGVILIGLGKGA